MTDGALKAMARSRDLKAGHMVIEFDTPGIGYIMKEAGCEFTLFDTEHSGFTVETVKRVMAYLRAADLPAIVRVPSKNYEDIARTLDAGADALMLPMVNNVEEAEAIIDCMMYPPVGKRGVILRSAVDKYTAGPTLEKLDHQNKTTALFCQIESAEGVDNAEKIAALEQVDCLWVGHFDLSCSLGIPGEFDNPKFTEAIEAVVAAAKKTGTSLGRLTGNVDEGVELYRQGFDFVAYQTDAWALGDHVAAGLKALRAGCGQ